MLFSVHTLALLLTLWLAYLSPQISQVKSTPTVIPKVGDISIKIISPLPGQAIQGNVSIQGETNIEGFTRGEISFAYQNDPTDTWFLIHSTDAPAKGELFRWDTTAITDGNYKLRLVVLLNDGRQSTLTISNLRVRNYTPIETDTPAPALNDQSMLPQSTPSPPPRVIRATSTPLPDNPLALSQNDIYQLFTQGAVAACVLILAVMLVNAVKNSKNK